MALTQKYKKHMNKQYSPKTIIESHKVYSKFYNDKISITLSYAGGAQPYCTHLKIYEDKKIGVFDMIYGDYFCNLFEAMDSFKNRCVQKKIYDTDGNILDEYGSVRKWEELDILVCPKPVNA